MFVVVLKAGFSSTRASTSGFCGDSLMDIGGISFSGRCGVGMTKGLFLPGGVGRKSECPTVVIKRPVKTIGRRDTGLCTAGVTRQNFIALSVSLSF